MSLLALLLLWTSGYSQNYPFPQSFKYPFGQLPDIDPAIMASKVQAQYEAWDNLYYVEKVIDGKTYGRIKFSQQGETGDATVSEGIAYGMLIYVYMENETNDTKGKFDALWNYYQRYSNSNGVMHWKIDAFGDPATAVIDPNGATDAEIDVATSLLLAYKQWGDEKYLQDASRLINTIWNYEIQQSTKAILPGDAVGFDQVLNPCYFTTNGIGLFQEASEKYPDDLPQLDWNAVVAKSYQIMQAAAHSKTGLVPDWVYNVDPTYPYISGVVDFEPNPSDPKFTSDYKYDAVRIPWRTAHAYAWYGHEEAQAIASKITKWAISQYGASGAANMVDGYKADGTEIGASSNACFTGGFAIGGMVGNDGETDMLSFLTSGFNQTDLGENGSYFNHTTQLMYMMVMSGNMPNFYSMSPTILDATIREAIDGANNVLDVTMSQEIDENSVSVDGWSIKTDENTLPVGIVSITALSSKKIKIVLDGVVVDAGTFISYDGTGDLKKLEGGTAVPAIDDFRVLNLYPFKRPAILSLSSNPDGTKIVMMLDKELWDKSLEPSAPYFTVTSGSKSLNVSGVTADPSDGKIVILEIEGSDQVANRIAEGDEVSLTYANTVLMTENRAKVKTFADRPVENLTVTVECDIVTDSEGESLGTWDSAPIDASDVFSAFASNPLSNGDNNSLSVIQFVHDASSSEWSAPKFKINSTTITDFNSLLANGQYVLNFKLYAPNADDLGKELMFMFFNSADNDNDGSYSQAGHNFKGRHTISTIGDWVNVEIDLGLYANSSITADMFEMSVERGVVGGSGEVYVDDIKFCTPQPSAQIAKAMTSFNGDKVKASFKTAMAVPSDLSGFEVVLTSGSVSEAASVTSAMVDPTDSKTLILELSTNVAVSDEVSITYAGETVKTVDGRYLEPFKNFPVINAVNRAITTGWRDDFNDCSAGDYVTTNIGGDAYGAIGNAGEDCSGIGTYTIEGAGTEGWEQWGIYLKDAIMDLSKNPTVEIKFTCEETIYIRCDLKDYINDRTTDQMPFVEFEAGSHTYVFEFEGVKMLNEYDPLNAGEVDITNIYEVGFYVFQSIPTGAAGAKTVATPVVFDYINIGASVTLNGVPANVAQGDEFNPVSSEDGSIFAINMQKVTDATGSAEIERDPAILRYYVEQGFGAEYECVAGQPITIGTTEMSGYYKVMSYDPATSAVSFPKGITINDETAPNLLDVNAGVKIIGSNVSAAADEFATFYLIDVTNDPPLTSYSKIVKASVNKTTAPSAAAGEYVKIDLTADNGVVMGHQYVVVAIDGSTNFSAPSDTITVTTLGDPVINIKEEGPYHLEDVITVTVDRAVSLQIYEPGSTAALLESSIQAFAGVPVEITLETQYMDFLGFIFGFEEPHEYVIVAQEIGTSKYGELPFFIGDEVHPLTAISVPSSLTMFEEASADLLITPIPGNANDIATVVVDLSNDNIAYTKTDDLNYTISGLAAGDAEITVTVTTNGGDEFSEKIPVTVKPITNTDLIPASIEISPATAETITIGSDFIFSAEVFNDKGVSTDVPQEVTVTIVSGADFISLDGKTITGLAEGEAVVKVTSASVSTVSEQITITVEKVAVAEVKVTPVTLSLKAGDVATAPIVVKVLPETATFPEVSYVIDNTDIISLDDAGYVTALAEGSATITYTADGVSGKCDVDVSLHTPTEISVTSENFLSSEFIIEPLQYTIIHEASSIDFVDARVSFKSSNTDAVIIDQDGKMTPGGSTGEATITVTSIADGSVFGTATIIVLDEINKVAKVELDKATLELNIGDDYTFTATLTGEDATKPVSNAAVTYSVTGDAVELLDATTGKISAVKAGDATVTVTTEDGSFTASCEVTVSTIPVSTLVVTSGTTVELNKGDKEQITYTIGPDGAFDDIQIAVTSGTDVVSVDDNNFITALAGGTAEITVYSAANPETVVEVITVTVAVPATKVAFTVTDRTVVPDGTLDLSSLVKITPLDATQTDLVWEVTGSATIDQSGKLSAGSVEEDVVVTVSIDGTTLSATLPVMIKDVVIPVESVDFSQASVTVAEEASVTVTAYTNNDATDKTLDFTVTSGSSNITHTETYDEATGKYTVKITGVSEGTASIKAVSGSYSDVLSITVTPIEHRVETITIKDAVTIQSEGVTTIPVLSSTPDGHDPIDWTYRIVSGSKFASINVATGELTAKAVSQNSEVVVVAEAIYDDETITSNECVVTIAYIVEKVTKVVIDQTATELTDKKTGDKGTITFTVTPQDAVPDAVKFSSSSEFVTINAETGAWEVLDQPAYGSGDLDVTLTLEVDDLAPVTVTLTVSEKEKVADILVTALNLTSTSLEIEEGGTITLEPTLVTVVPYNATNKAYTWVLVDDNAPATISGTTLSADKGVANVGQTFEIKAVANDIKKVESDPITVTIVKVDVTDWKPARNSSGTDEFDDPFVMSVGDVQQVYASFVAPTNATYSSGINIVLESSDTDVVSISGRKITAESAGDVVITATLDGVVKTINVKVEAEPLDYAELETLVAQVYELALKNADLIDEYKAANSVLNDAKKGQTTQAKINEQIEILKAIVIVAVNEIEVGVAPVPFTTELKVTAANITSVKIVAASSIVETVIIDKTADAVVLDVSALKRGVYFLLVVTEDGSATVEIVK